MGNEDKVKRDRNVEKNADAQDLIAVKSRFLPADIGDSGTKSEVYALDKEFAATAKNRSWLFWLLTFGFLAVIVGSTFVITRFVQGRHNRVELAILEFEEIKLKDILDATRNDEKNLELARRELETLRAKYRETLAELKERRANESEIAKARTDYSAKIAAQQKIVGDYEQKVNSRHREMNEGVAKVENMLSNHERLMKLRLDKQQAEYERKIADLILKYNPNFSDRELKKLVVQERLTTRIKEPVLAAIPPEFTREKIVTKEKFDRLRSEQAETRRLLARLRQVPYINSVAPALTGIERRNAEATGQYEAIVDTLLKTLRRKNALIGNYRLALKDLAEREREYGYIIDARNPQKMRIYLNPSLRVKAGLKANIFRKDDEYIADIEIFSDSDGACAKVLKIADGKTIASFDKIYLEDR